MTRTDSRLIAGLPLFPCERSPSRSGDSIRTDCSRFHSCWKPAMERRASSAWKRIDCASSTRAVSQSRVRLPTNTCCASLLRESLNVRPRSQRRGRLTAVPSCRALPHLVLCMGGLRYRPSRHAAPPKAPPDRSMRTEFIALASYEQAPWLRTGESLFTGTLLAPPRPWTHLHRSAEDTCEMTLIRETTRQCDLEQG